MLIMVSSICQSNRIQSEYVPYSHFNILLYEYMRNGKYLNECYRGLNSLLNWIQYFHIPCIARNKKSRYIHLFSLQNICNNLEFFFIENFPFCKQLISFKQKKEMISVENYLHLFHTHSVKPNHLFDKKNIYILFEVRRKKTSNSKCHSFM